MGYFLELFLILALGVIGHFVVRRHVKNGRRASALVGVATVVLLAVTTLWNMAYQVPAGHVGIVYTFGGITDQRSDGLQWIAPWANLRIASVQVQGHKFDKLSSFSKETQDVFVDATINVQVSSQNIQELYRDVGANYFDILVRPRVLQAFKDEIVKFTSVDIAPNREAIRKTVRERLTKELETHSIAVQDLLIDNISFSGKFQNAIEEKQSQSQLALAEREKVAARKAEADQAIEKARGEGQAILDVAAKQAEANKMLAESITPAYVQYLFATKLAPNVNVMMVPSGQQFMLGPDAFKRTGTTTAQP